MQFFLINQMITALTYIKQNDGLGVHVILELDEIIVRLNALKRYF